MLALLVLALAATVPWESVSRPVRLLPCLLFLVAVFLLRLSVGSSAGVGILSLLPICWLALHGTRRELFVGLGGVAAFWMLPVLLIGGDGFPPQQLRTGAMYVAVAALIGLTVHELVGALASQARDVARVAKSARSIMVSQDGRAEICNAAREVSGASFVFLFEPIADGNLCSTAMSGIETEVVTIRKDSRTSATGRAFTTHQPIWARDAATYPGLSRAMWDLHGRPASMLFEPVLRGDIAVGVLVVGWAQRMPDARTGGPSLIGLLAAEAATAIAHADLIDQLGQQAATDALTGLPNRRAWTRALERVMEANPRSTFSVAMVDMDYFKAFNDAHGHLAGDRHLKHSASAWRTQLRPSDVLARVGGEEFACCWSTARCRTPSW